MNLPPSMAHFHLPDSSNFVTYTTGRTGPPAPVTGEEARLRRILKQYEPKKKEKGGTKNGKKKAGSATDDSTHLTFTTLPGLTSNAGPSSIPTQTAAPDVSSSSRQRNRQKRALSPTSASSDSNLSTSNPQPKRQRRDQGNLPMSPERSGSEGDCRINSHKGKDQGKGSHSNDAGSPTAGVAFPESSREREIASLPSGSRSRSGIEMSDFPTSGRNGPSESKTRGNRLPARPAGNAVESARMAQEGLATGVKAKGLPGVEVQKYISTQPEMEEEEDQNEEEMAEEQPRAEVQEVGSGVPANSTAPKRKTKTKSKRPLHPLPAHPQQLEASTDQQSQTKKTPYKKPLQRHATKMNDNMSCAEKNQRWRHSAAGEEHLQSQSQDGSASTSKKAENVGIGIQNGMRIPETQPEPGMKDGGLKGWKVKDEQEMIEKREGKEDPLKICKYWARGFCANAVHCSFLHPIPENPFEKWLVPVPDHFKTYVDDVKKRKEQYRRRVEGSKRAAAAREAGAKEASDGKGKTNDKQMDYTELTMEKDWMRLASDFWDREYTTEEEELMDREMGRDNDEQDDEGSISDSEGEEDEAGIFTDVVLNSVQAMGTWDAVKYLEGAGIEDPARALFDIMAVKDDRDEARKAAEALQEEAFNNDPSPEIESSNDNSDVNMDHQEPIPPPPPYPEGLVWFKSGGENNGPFCCRLPQDPMRDPRYNDKLFVEIDDLFGEQLCSFCREDLSSIFMEPTRGRKKPNMKQGKMTVMQVYEACGHSMCSTCTKVWRHPKKPPPKKGHGADPNQPDVDRFKNRYKCTICNEESRYTFPSNLNIRKGTDVAQAERLQECLAAYKDYCGRKPCKYICQTTKPNRKPFRPFGDDCFYKHEVKGKEFKFKKGVDAMIKIYKTNRNNRHERAARRAARLRRYGRNLASRLNKLWKIINLKIFRLHPWKHYTKPSATYTGRIVTDVKGVGEVGSLNTVIKRLEGGGKGEFAGRLRKVLELDKRIDFDKVNDIYHRRKLFHAIVELVYEKWPKNEPVGLVPGSGAIAVAPAPAAAPAPAVGPDAMLAVQLQAEEDQDVNMDN